tara:strand:- start:727 stop:948 length:222 start_codon:yes stop_codon:yes gene_type:complete
MTITIGKHAVTLFDGRRRVAVARQTGSGKWLVNGYTLSWLEKGQLKNCFGISNPSILVLETKRDVIKLFTPLD